jgi:lysophospholipid acyltransferase (LPLAT)-like uncharacterized protein
MRIRSKLLTKFAGWAIATVMKGLLRTVRITGYVEQPATDPSLDAEQSFIYSLWHDEILIPLAMQDRARAPIAALVSRHQDGSYLTEFMGHLGVRSLRGSSNHGGVEVLRQLMQETAGYHIFITPDGPRGPHHELKEGIVFLASKTGLPIVLIASVCENAWYVPGKWTGLVLPKPFSRATYLLSRPIRVPAELTREELTEWQARVQGEALRLEEKLREVVAGRMRAPEPALVVRRAA